MLAGQHREFCCTHDAPRPSYLAAFAALAAVLAICLAWSDELGFSSSLTPRLIEQLAGKFGADARTRLAAWQKFILRQRLPEDQRERLAGKTERDILEAVNVFFNRVPFVDDLKHWGLLDYWASPAEMLASNGGDCEDFSIAKYFALKEIGIPISKLRITYVKATRINQAHMVVAYYAGQGAEPLILDNLEDQIRPASQRPDLIPVYAFNDDEVRLAKTGERAGSPTQIRIWRGLLDKLERERRM
ncbi:MAG: transglutaminase-like cysteine peptidase [Betaproteobacteria bacterium]|nr:transglutaminase-like cysteine peptidase [Betaproteobacteria bacterium]